MSAPTAAPEVMGRCRKGHVVLGFYADLRGGWLTCPCGSQAVSRSFTTKVTATKCGGKCTSAVGPKCECECGGRRHGSDLHG